MVAAPIAWAAQEWFGWYLSSAPCDPHTVSSAVIDHTRWWLTGVHVAALLVALSALWAGWRGWHRSEDVAARDNPVLVDRYLGAVGTIISAIGLAALVWASLGTYMLPACEAMR